METGLVDKLVVKYSAWCGPRGAFRQHHFVSHSVGHAQRQLTSKTNESNLKCEVYDVTAIHAVSFNRTKSINGNVSFV